MFIGIFHERRKFDQKKYFSFFFFFIQIRFELLRNILRTYVFQTLQFDGKFCADENLLTAYFVYDKLTQDFSQLWLHI